MGRKGRWCEKGGRWYGEEVMVELVWGIYDMSDHYGDMNVMQLHSIIHNTCKCLGGERFNDAIPLSNELLYPGHGSMTPTHPVHCPLTHPVHVSTNTSCTCVH